MTRRRARPARCATTGRATSASSRTRSCAPPSWRAGRTLVPEDFALAGQARAAAAEALPLEDAVRQRLAELLAAGRRRHASDLYTTLITAVERPLIEVVLERAGGNQVKAADMLGINRNTLRKKITELGIPIRRAAARSGDARCALPPLYAIVDPLDTGRDPVDLAAALLAGGARVLQLRLKASPARELLDGRARRPPLTRARRRAASS